MISPYENIINAIPEKELEMILKNKGYAKVREEKVLKPKKMSEEQELFNFYTDKLKLKLHKVK